MKVQAEQFYVPKIRQDDPCEEMDKEALIESMSHPENLVDDIEEEIELRIPCGIIVVIELA